MSKILERHLESLRTQADEIAKVEAELDKLKAKRDNRIAAASKAGGSSRIIGAAAGVTHAAVAKILKKADA